MERVTYFDNELVYVLSFEPTKFSEKNTIAGEVVIHSESFAIIQFKKHLTEGGIIRANQKNISGNMKGKSITFDGQSTEIFYREKEGHWLPFMASSNLAIDYKNTNPSERLSGILHFNSRMVITEVSEDLSQFPKKGKVKRGDVSYEKAAEFFDENFWENFNRIEVEKAEKGVSKVD